jgi:oxygen-independent coproporphyrinogen-3 oxidase
VSEGEGRGRTGFGVYVHWPYCARICPYCDFNVYAAKGRDERPLGEAIIADLAGQRARSGRRTVGSVFFGGGTPSLMSAGMVARILAEIDRLWGLAPDAEVTLEANPEDFRTFEALAQSGVTRLSLGVQALDAGRLAFLGRRHDAATARTALAEARPLFSSVSIDLIYATPGQTLGAWREELEEAMETGPDHLSLYELSVEAGAAFAFAVRRGDWAPVDDDSAAQFYEVTQSVCDARGYPAYEVSNHARAAADQSRHNRLYWRSGDWIGVGPGAHGRLTTGEGRLSLRAADAPRAYSDRVAATGVGDQEAELLSPLEVARERLLMGLRLVEGLPCDDLADLGFGLREETLSELSGHGFLEHDGRIVRLTPAGRLTADRIALMLAP